MKIDALGQLTLRNPKQEPSTITAMDYNNMSKTRKPVKLLYHMHMYERSCAFKSASQSALFAENVITLWLYGFC